MTENSWVHACYDAILDRAPDADGLEFHTHMMATEDPTGASVIKSLLSSDEYRQKFGRRMGVHRCFDFRILMPETDWMLDGIVTSGVYEPYVIEAFREASVDARVLDVGANIGIFSLSAAQVTRKMITAVEAISENARLIECNVRLNGATNVEVYAMAASDRIGPAVLHHGGHSNGVARERHSITPQSLEQFSVAVGLPLDMVIRDKIDVFKIDVEGREYAALQGARQILDGKPTLFVEFSPHFMMDGCGVEPEAFMAPFFERGYGATILHRDMTREPVGRNVERLKTAWAEYMDRNVTHLDLMLKAS